MDAVSLVSAWNALVNHLSCVFTAPTARVWQQIALGWVLHRGPATVTGMVQTLGDLAERHWTVYEKFFYRAAWSLDALCLRLVRHVVYPLIVQSGLKDETTGQPAADLIFDDTTAARSGKHVAHAGWFKDASASGGSHRGTVIHWAHNWIVGAVALRLPQWPGLRWALPVLFALYRKRPDCNRKHPFRTRQTLAAQMVKTLAQAVPEVRWRLATDGQYATREMIAGLPPEVNLVSRLRRDAALYDLPPKRRRPGQRGATRKRGRRLPSPEKLARRRQGWKTVTVRHQGRTVKRRVLGITCLWYRVCREKPIRLVIVRDPSGTQKDDYLFCTDAAVPETQVVQRFIDRWGVEEAIFEAKQHLGFESTRGWCSRTVNRQAPLAMLLLTLVKAWYAAAAKAAPELLPDAPPWYPRKTRPAFLNMLSALRSVLWRHRIMGNSTLSGRVEKMFTAVSHALCAAA